ncbi:MAG: hypothetical protein AAFV30_05365 [Pseudomonadota bacterium]
MGQALMERALYSTDDGLLLSDSGLMTLPKSSCTV